MAPSQWLCICWMLFTISDKPAVSRCRISISAVLCDTQFHMYDRLDAVIEESLVTLSTVAWFYCFRSHMLFSCSFCICVCAQAEKLLLSDDWEVELCSLASVISAYVMLVLIIGKYSLLGLWLTTDIKWHQDSLLWWWNIITSATGSRWHILQLFILISFWLGWAHLHSANMLVPKGPYTLTSFLVPVAGASQLAPVN